MKVITDAGVIEIGTTETAPTIGLTDYSRRETDDFGVTTVVKRNFSRTMSARVMVPTANVDALQRQLAALRAKPVQWVADDRFDSLSITGFYKDLSIDLAIPPVSYCTLTIEGLAEGADYADPGTDPATDQRKSTLRLLRPASIDDAVLTSSNVPENDYPAWSASTTYALGARVILSATHRIYESAANGNVGNDPTGAAGQWIDIAPTNRWAMFDEALGSQTERAGSIVVSLDPVDPIDAVALLDVTAVSVRVQAPGYDRTLSPAIQPGAVTFLDLPATAGAVTITISGSGTVSAGTLLIGKLLGLGTTEASPTAAITDYSRKETDAFGEVTVVERAWAKRMDVKSLISTAAVDVVAARIANVRAMPALWIGDATLESLAIYGFFKDFSIAVDEHVSTLSLSIEGLSTAAKLAPLGADVSWSDIKDDDPAHPKPEDGATVGATPEQVEQIADAQFTADAAAVAVAAAQAQIAAIESSVSADFSQVNAALSTLNGEVDTAQSNITSLQSSTSSLNTAVTTLQGEVSTAQTNISSLQSQAAGIISDVDGLEAQIIAQGGQISTLQTTMSSQGAQISTLQTTVSNAVGDVATVKTQINAGGGNLLVNTDFGLDTSGWIFAASGGNGSVGLRNAPDAQWYPPNENTIVIQQNNTTSTGYADWTQTIEVAATKWHDVSVYAASHRCPIQIYLMWLDSAGAAIGSAPSIGPFGPAGGGNTLASFPVRSFKAQAPTGAVRARLYLRKFGTNSGTTDSWAWFLRPQVAEVLADTATPIAYSPGSARSTISVQATALSSLTTTVSTLSTTVSTQGGSISTLQSSVTTLQGSVTTLQTTVSTQGTNITSLQTAVSTAQGDLATLKTQVTAGGGNLLVNTDFAIDTSGWSTSLQNSTVADRVPSGDQWMVTGENGLRLFQPNGTTTGYSEWSAFTAVEAGKWYDVSVYAAAHRCQVQIYLQWVDSAGESPLGAPSSGLMSTLTGGNLLGNWTRIGFKAQAPVGAVRARFILRKFGTLAGASEANSYAWFLRPQVAETLATSATPIAYAPGSARAVIETQAQALSTATSSLAALSTTVSTQGGSISTLQSSMTSAQGSISTLQSTVSTQGGQISTLQSTSSTQAGQISTLQSTVSTQGGSISTMQSTLTTLQGTVSTLSTVVTASSNPNVLPNGGFENQLKGWTGSGSTGAPTSGWFQANNGSWGFYAANNTAWTGSSTLQFSTLNSDLISGIDAGATFTVAADADIRANSAGAEAWVQIIWVTSSGTVYSDGPHRSVETGFGFDPSGASRVTFKATYAAPANVTNMRVSLVVSAPPGVTVTGTAWRQVKLERGSLATPYSGEATAAQMYQAYSTLDTSFASLSTTVSTQGGSISTLQSSMTSAQGSISTLQSTVSTQGGQISTLQSTSSTQAGQISTLQSTVSTQGGSISTLQSSMTTAQGNISTLQSTVSAQGTSISTLQSAVSTAQGDLATLKTQVTAGGGNLLVNTDAAVDISGWSTGGAMTTGAVFGINIAGDAYRPVPDNNLSIQQTNTDSSGYQEYTQQVAVEANKWYYSSVYAASHRCSTALYVLFFDSSGAAISGAGLSVSSTGAGTGGNTLAAYALMSGKAQAPADAVTARFYLRKFSTLSGQTPDSYAWFCRPQLAETTANATTPPAYAPGSARATIQMQASALSTLTTQYASLSSSVSVQGASITAQSIAISTLNGNVAALFAKSSLMIEAGNVITGWENSTNGQTSSFRIRADIFELVPSNGSGARTEYSNGNWRVYHPNGVLATRNGVW